VPREVQDGVYWVYEGGHDRSDMVTDEAGNGPEWYREDETVHICQSAYVVVGEESTLLFDTLSPASEDHLLEELDEILGERTLDYLVVSHPDVPHAGNAMATLRAYPDCELVAPRYGNDHELYRLDDATHVGEGDSIDLGGFVVDFHEATFLDSPVHLWMSERTMDALFTVDWLGFPHRSDEALRCVDEIDADLTPDRLFTFAGRVLFWHQYVDVPKVQREIDHLIAHYDPEMIFPAHGLVIREDATRYMEMMKGVVADVSESERIGILG
jgi:flavorubredoxin